MRLRRRIFKGIPPMSNVDVDNENDPWRARASRGLTHRWRIGDPDIPCQVASPQSLPPLLRATQPYRFSILVASTVGHRSYASKIHCRLVWLSVRFSRMSPKKLNRSTQRSQRFSRLSSLCPLRSPVNPFLLSMAGRNHRSVIGLCVGTEKIFAGRKEKNC